MKNKFLGKSEYVEENGNPIIILCLRVVPEDIGDFKIKLDDSLNKIDSYKNMSVHNGGICKRSIKVYFKFKYNNLKESLKDCENKEIEFNMNKFEECCIGILKEVKLKN